MKKIQYLISAFCMIYGLCPQSDLQSGQAVFTAFVLWAAALFPIVHILRDEDKRRSFHNNNH